MKKEEKHKKIIMFLEYSFKKRDPVKMRKVCEIIIKMAELEESSTELLKNLKSKMVKMKKSDIIKAKTWS